MKDTIIGVDLAKRVFQLHGATTTGHVMFRKKLTREQFRRFIACTVVFEACGSASHWAREMARLGHDARLIAPQYVRPFVKRRKTIRLGDCNRGSPARDALCGTQAVEQQSRAAVFRGRERLVLSAPRM